MPRVKFGPDPQRSHELRSHLIGCCNKFYSSLQYDQRDTPSSSFYCARIKSRKAMQVPKIPTRRLHISRHAVQPIRAFSIGKHDPVEAKHLQVWRSRISPSSINLSTPRFRWTQKKIDPDMVSSRDEHHADSPTTMYVRIVMSDTWTSKPYYFPTSEFLHSPHLQRKQGCKSLQMPLFPAGQDPCFRAIKPCPCTCSLATGRDMYERSTDVGLDVLYCRPTCPGATQSATLSTLIPPVIFPGYRESSTDTRRTRAARIHFKVKRM